MKPIHIPWDHAVKIETRDGARKAEGVEIDWLERNPFSSAPGLVGFLENIYEDVEEEVQVPMRDPAEIAAEVKRRRAANLPLLEQYGKKVMQKVRKLVCEGGNVAVSQGDWFIREHGVVFAMKREEFDRQWRDPIAEAKRAKAWKEKAEREAKEKADQEAREEAVRKAKNEEDAKRLLAEKEEIVVLDDAQRDALKRARDGSTP